MADVPLMSNPMTTAEDVIVGGASGAPGRLAIGSVGDVLTVSAGTAVSWAAPAGSTTGTPYEVDYAEKTSSTSITATTEGGADTIVTGGTVAFDGSTVAIIEFFAPYITGSSAGATTTLVLYDGASSVGKLGIKKGTASAPDYDPVHPIVRITPSNASHTYSVRAYVSTGSGTVGGAAGGSGNYFPAFIRISKLTA